MNRDRNQHLECASVLQRQYYDRTATSYNEHVNHGDEHFFAAELALHYVDVLQCRSVLDVGAGTGRLIHMIAQARPQLDLIGIEPVQSLISQRPQEQMGRGGWWCRGTGLALPFKDNSIDFVCETATLHHVPEPERFVAEMLRVARLGVMISDSNRFGQGSCLARGIKYFLFRAGLWQQFIQLRSRGRGYFESEGDGVFFSYSVYDNLSTVEAWADTCIVVGTTGSQARHAAPLFFSPTVAVIAFKSVDR